MCSKLVLFWSLFITNCLGNTVQQTPVDGVLKVLVSGEWRTVFEPVLVTFETKEVKVLCRSMGLPTDDVSVERRMYSASQGGAPPVVLDLACQGNETDISHCSTHKTEEASNNLVRKTITLSCHELEMKLMFGTNHSGLVVAKQGNKYYPVCADSLWLYNSQWSGAFCRALGLPSSEAVSLYDKKYSDSNNVTKAVMMVLDCPGDKTSACQVHTAPSGKFCGDYTFRYAKLGAVLCTDTAPEYRLTYKLPGDIGRLEVKVEGQWGGVCVSVSGIAEVACRSLKSPSTDAQTYNQLSFGGYIAPATETIYCHGNESTITECPVVQFGKGCSKNKYVGLSCKTAHEGKLRLVGFMGGEVQVYHNNSWHGIGVSPSSSPKNVATVICRSLNMSTNFVYGQHTAHNRTLWLSNVHCDGDETDIFKCQKTSLISTTATTWHTGLVVTCDMGDEEVRLQSDGRLEIRHNGIWGTICAKKLADVMPYRHFNNLEASVICKHLGKPSTLASVYFPSNSSEYTGLVWLDRLRCDSTSTPWKNCTHGDWGDVDCNHNDDVFIKCEELNESSIEYRLTHSIFPYVGIYEMSLNGVWGSICRHLRHQYIDPKVLCRSLDMRTDGARILEMTSLFHFQSTTLWLDSLNCTGLETSPLDCQHSYIGDTICIRPGILSTAVYCGPPQTIPDYSLRLVDGPNNSSGRLEMMLYGKWGTICDRNFTIDEGNVACRQLDLPTSVVTVGDEKYKQGTGRIWNIAVHCASWVTSMDRCSFTPTTDTLCDHSRDVGIQCNNYPDIVIPDFHLGDDNIPIIVGSVIGGAAAVFLIGIIIFLIAVRKGFLRRAVLTPDYSTPGVNHMLPANADQVPMRSAISSKSKMMTS